jgi:hypothetical protein
MEGRMRTAQFTFLVAAGSIALLLSAGEVSAQETTLKVGVASSTFAAEGRENVDSTGGRGLVAGASFFLTAADVGGWQLEALVIQKRARNLLRQGDEIRLTYLELPVVLHADFWQQDDNGAYFAIGPSVAVRLQANYLDETGVSEDIGDDVAGVDVGLHFAGGIELGALVIDARYILGLRSAFVDDGRPFRNRTFAVTAGVRLR